MTNVGERHRARGRALIGCSGWTYRSWRGRFYPEALAQRHWLGHYAEHFATVESNASFYRLPQHETVRGWAERVPDGFVMAVKLGQFGSHRMKLRDPESWLPNHVNVIGELGAHLGPTLVQLPPRWHRDLGRLGHFLEVAGSLAPSWRWAVEFRDPTWLHDETFDLLARHGAALCLHDLLPAQPLQLTTSWTYVRFHGPDAAAHPYVGTYGGRRLAQWSERLQAWREAGVDSYCYFNNDIDGAAPVDAAWLSTAITGEPERRSNSVCGELGRGIRT